MQEVNRGKSDSIILLEGQTEEGGTRKITLWNGERESVICIHSYKLYSWQELMLFH